MRGRRGEAGRQGEPRRQRVSDRRREPRSVLTGPPYPSHLAHSSSLSISSSSSSWSGQLAIRTYSRLGGLAHRRRVENGLGNGPAHPAVAPTIGRYFKRKTDLEWVVYLRDVLISYPYLVISRRMTLSSSQSDYVGIFLTNSSKPTSNPVTLKPSNV